MATSVLLCCLLIFVRNDKIIHNSFLCKQSVKIRNILTIVVLSLSRLLWCYLRLFLQPKKTNPSRMSLPCTLFSGSSNRPACIFGSLDCCWVRAGLVRFDPWLIRPKAFIRIISPLLRVAELDMVRWRMSAVRADYSRFLRYSYHWGSFAREV